MFKIKEINFWSVSPSGAESKDDFILLVEAAWAYMWRKRRDQLRNESTGFCHPDRKPDLESIRKVDLIMPLLHRRLLLISLQITQSIATFKTALGQKAKHVANKYYFTRKDMTAKEIDRLLELDRFASDNPETGQGRWYHLTIFYLISHIWYQGNSVGVGLRIPFPESFTLLGSTVQAMFEPLKRQLPVPLHHLYLTRTSHNYMETCRLKSITFYLSFVISNSRRYR